MSINECEEAVRDLMVDLYGEELSDVDEGVEDYEICDEAGDDIPSPEALEYSPLMSPETRRRRDSGEFDRSRSPLREGYVDQISYVICIYDENSEQLTSEDVELDAVECTEFFAPDAHAPYVSERDVEESLHVSVMSEGEVRSDRNVDDIDDRDMNVDERDLAERNVSGNVRRVQGGRRARARRRESAGRGLRGRRRADGKRNRWAVGNPLTEIWMTDDDVPSELLQTMRDVVCRREQRALESSSRQGARTERDRDQDDRGKDGEITHDEEFQDAVDGRGNSLLEGEALHFEWLPMESFRGKEEAFIPERTGSVECHQTPYDAFRSYWDDDILQHIVDETNRYATNITSSAFQSSWYPTNTHELMCLFAFWMMLGIIRMPTFKSCFSTNPNLKTEVFRRIFSYKRCNNLMRALHFADSTNSNSVVSSDLLHKLRPIITHLNAKFQANYIMSKDICIDESLTLWKGRLNFKQYIPLKAAKLGVKSFELCESATGYLWSFITYTGKQRSSDLIDIPGIAKSTAVVVKLIEPLLHKGHRLFMDNWYNCPLLARFLKRNGTDCVGTLRLSRPDVPALLSHAPLKQGQFLARHSGDITILSWQDKKRVNMISTCHGAELGLARVLSKSPTCPLPSKPQVVLDYNRSMGGVEVKDQMLEPYLIERKRCAKWYMKVFKRLLNCSILNSRILLESTKQCRQDQLGFRLQLVDSILTRHLLIAPKTLHTYYAPRHIPISHGGTITNTHWPVPIEQREKDQSNNRKSRGRCKQCAKVYKSVFTRYKCDTCNVILCVSPCFKDFHNLT